MYLERIVAGAAMAGALGVTALGLGAGIANAESPAPIVSGIAWQQDRDGHWGHGGDGGNWGGGDWGNRGDWGGGDWGNRGDWGQGPGWGPCVSVPFVSFCP